MEELTADMVRRCPGRLTRAYERGALEANRVSRTIAPGVDGAAGRVVEEFVLDNGDRVRRVQQGLRGQAWWEEVAESLPMKSAK